MYGGNTVPAWAWGTVEHLHCLVHHNHWKVWWWSFHQHCWAHHSTEPSILYHFIQFTAWCDLWPEQRNLVFAVGRVCPVTTTKISLKCWAAVWMAIHLVMQRGHSCPHKIQQTYLAQKSNFLFLTWILHVYRFLHVHYTLNLVCKYFRAWK